MFLGIDSLRSELILNGSNIPKDSRANAAREKYKLKNNVDHTDSKWKLITLYGVSTEIIEEASNYNINNKQEFKWTDAGNKCPVHKKFIEDNFNLGNNFYIKYAVLEPGGYTLPHSDMGNFNVGDKDYNPGSEFYALTFMIKNAPGNIFKFNNYGNIPIKEGKGFLLNVDHIHCTYNRSSENRYHMMIVNTDRTKSILNLFKDKSIIQRSWKNSFNNFKN